MALFSEGRGCTPYVGMWPNSRCPSPRPIPRNAPYVGALRLFDEGEVLDVEPRQHQSGCCSSAGVGERPAPVSLKAQKSCPAPRPIPRNAPYVGALRPRSHSSATPPPATRTSLPEKEYPPPAAALTLAAHPAGVISPPQSSAGRSPGPNSQLPIQFGQQFGGQLFFGGV